MVVSAPWLGAAPGVSVPLEPPVYGYATEPAFGSLRFTDPVAILTPPGETNRLFVVEQRGRVAVIPDLRQPERQVFLDLTSRVAGGTPSDERGLLGMAFHPGYATNRQFYLFYSTTQPGSLHQRVSRFLASSDDANLAVAGSEVVLIQQFDEAGNHNGGDLHFGRDGYLYVSLGDEGGQNDAYNNSQRIDRDFFSGILRIDVDGRAGSLEPNAHPAVRAGTYRVPADNPWVGATEFNGRSVDPTRVRTEFWAVGLRNPWRMSFDPVTGALWTGDVGGSVREEINRIVGGGNYGWAYREGTLAGPKSGQAPVGFVSEPPVVAYAHGNGTMQGRSVTGGVVYRGQRLSQLHGAYVFSDYVSGNLWAVHDPYGSTPSMVRLTSRNGVAGFGVDPRNGDVLLADQPGDGLRRLVYAGEPVGAPLPPTLAETGVFSDLETLTPAPGVQAYAINLPFWSDGAEKQRWVVRPMDGGKIGFRRDEPWQFPLGMVWVKHFELQLNPDDPSTRRRVETRLLVRNAGGVHGFTYRWTDPPTNAVLVAEEGMEGTVEVWDGDAVWQQPWSYPSRAQCLQCHTPAAGWALSFHTRQLHRDGEVGGMGPGSQLEWMAEAGYFETAPEGLETLPFHADPADEEASVEWRVRSWLDVNCAGCHQPGGGALGAWDARARVPLSLTGLVDGRLNNDEGDALNRLVAPGDVPRTMLHSRVTRLGEGRMPPITSRVVDEVSAALLRRWVTNTLPSWEDYGTWRTRQLGDVGDDMGGEEADPDEDGAKNRLEYLTDTDPEDPAQAWGIAVEPSGTEVRFQYDRQANRGYVVEWTTEPGLGVWQEWQDPRNRPYWKATSDRVTWQEPATEEARYYRVRVFEP
jgi:glucose/arabinose dehydrogenase/mono/diheme cytochrome c family protein